MTVRKITVRNRDGTAREYWLLDLRYRGRGVRRRFGTKAEAVAARQRYEQGRRRGRTPGRAPTITEFAETLLADRAGTVAASTYTILAQQLGHLTRYPVREGVALGMCRLDLFDSDPRLAVDMVKWFAAQGYAPATVRLFRAGLKELLDRAKHRGYLLEHPLQDTEVQRDLRNLAKTLREATPPEVKAFTAEQARHFLAVAERDSRLFALFATGFSTGPRLGELLALRMADDEQRWVEGRLTRQLHIHQALTQRMSRRTPQPKQLKNAANYYVDVPADLGILLDAHKGTLRDDVPWLFQTGTARPFSHEHVQGEFKRILRRAGLDDPRHDFTPHSMRHTFATLHILAGKPAKWVSQQLGHADVTVTLKIYARWLTQACPGAADDHGAALLGWRVRLDGTPMASPTMPTATEGAPILH
jgi:integrase